MNDLTVRAEPSQGSSEQLSPVYEDSAVDHFGSGTVINTALDLTQCNRVTCRVVKHATYVGNHFDTLGSAQTCSCWGTVSIAYMQVCNTETTSTMLTASPPDSTPTINSPQVRNFPGITRLAAAFRALKRTETARLNIRRNMTRNQSKLLFNRFLNALLHDSGLPDQARCQCFG